MLEDLSIKDFAIIEHENIEFKKGFTVLSGETGAGKSILIGALSFVLGGKAEVSQIRQGCHEALVNATFFLEEGTSSEAKEWLSEHEIELENSRILLRRFIRENGKTAAFIGDKQVTRTELSDFSSFLVDIHGQHQHQSLMKVSEHRKFLDSRAGIEGEVNAFTKLYTELVEKRKALSELENSFQDRERRLDMYNFAIKEITDAKLLPQEDEKLEDEEKKLSSYEKLFASIESIKTMLDGGEESVVSLLKKIRRESENASSFDKALSTLNDRIESSFYELSDISEEFSSYSEKLVFDPNHLSEIQERLSLIYNLKKKYASSASSPLKEVFDYLENAKAQVENLSSGAESKEKLQSEIKELEKKVYLDAKTISAKRKETSEKLSREIEEILNKLGMKGARFSVSLKEKPGSDVEQKCGPYGMDDVEFLISSNVGSPLQPLAKIASGGELSRVMLAIKTIFARNDPVETMIFDEIDTGIGGEVAVQIGEHLKKLSKTKQIFCITHLASIAVFADNQIKIKKALENGITQSSVEPVFGEARVHEIARMLSGDADSEASLEHAREMLAKYSV